MQDLKNDLEAGGPQSPPAYESCEASTYPAATDFLEGTFEGTVDQRKSHGKHAETVLSMGGTPGGLSHSSKIRVWFVGYSNEGRKPLGNRLVNFDRDYFEFRKGIKRIVKSAKSSHGRYTNFHSFQVVDAQHSILTAETWKSGLLQLAGVDVVLVEPPLRKWFRLHRKGLRVVARILLVLVVITVVCLIGWGLSKTKSPKSDGTGSTVGFTINLSDLFSSIFGDG